MQILSLLLVVFVDSLGNGLAFSTLAIVLFDPSFLSVDNISLNQYMGVIYELLIGVYSFSMFFSAPIIGEISDKLGRKPALKFSMLGLTIGLVLCAFGCYQKSLLILLLGRLISGFTAGSLSVAQAAIVDLSSPENKSRYLSIILIANCLGFAAGPFLSQQASFFSSFDLGSFAFLAGSLISLFAFLLISYFFKETYGQRSKQIVKISIVKSFCKLKDLLVAKNLSRYMLAFFSFMLVYTTFFSHLPLYIENKKIVNTINNGYILALLVASLSLSTFIAGSFFSQRNNDKIIMFCSVIQVISLLLIPYISNDLIINVGLFLVISITFGVIYITLVTVLSNKCSPDQQGKLMGCIASLSSLCWAFGAFLCGVTNQINTNLPILLGALITLLSIITFYIRYSTFNKLTKEAQ